LNSNGIDPQQGSPSVLQKLTNLAASLITIPSESKKSPTVVAEEIHSSMRESFAQDTNKSEDMAKYLERTDFDPSYDNRP